MSVLLVLATRCDSGCCVDVVVAFRRLGVAVVVFMLVALPLLARLRFC